MDDNRKELDYIHEYLNEIRTWIKDLVPVLSNLLDRIEKLENNRK